ncbi:MAG: hypothetical protein IJZ10_12585, partial [Thermoguttaceae bacterium]|nr:hypothetical protein [Thermoguttaceae bacterium]
MDELIPLFLRTGNKEALFAVFWATLGREPGKLADVDFATLRDLAERSGVKLTESQVRKRVDELKKLGILDVAPRRERGRFDLYVYRPAPFAAEAEKPEPATPLFDAAFGKGVESFVGDRAAPGPSFRSNSSSAPVGRDALAQLRATSDSAAVSETETETAAALETVESIRDRSRLTPFRCVELERVQTPEFATCAASPFAVEATENCVETPNRFAIERDRSRLAKPESGSRKPVASPLEEINNNKYIKTKTIKKPAKELE